MYTIVHKRALNPSVTWMDIEAPFIARKAKAGQFVILRVNETGERIPLTIASADPEKGTVTIIFQKVGKTTLLLDTLEEGDALPPRPRASRTSPWWAAAWAAPSPIPRPRLCTPRARRWI